MLIRRPDTQGTGKGTRATSDEALLNVLKSSNDDDCIALMGSVTTLNDGVRPAVITRLRSTDSPRLQQVLLNHLIPDIRDSEVLELLAELRSDDAGLRNQVIDALGKTPPDAPARALLEHQVRELMADPDGDTRILAINLAQAMQNDIFLPAIEDVLERDESVNVVATALDAVATLGGPEQAATVRGVAERFVSDAFIRFSVEQVLAALPGLDQSKPS